MAKMTPRQKQNAKKSAKKHGRKRPGLWENVNASKNKGPGNKKKGKTRPGRRSKTKKTGAAKRRTRRANKR